MLNEQDIANVERGFILEAAGGLWSHEQLVAIHEFCARCYGEIVEKLEAAS